MGPYKKAQDSQILDDGWTITDGDEQVIAHLDTETMADDLLAALSGRGRVTHRIVVSLSAPAAMAVDRVTTRLREVIESGLVGVANCGDDEWPQAEQAEIASLGDLNVLREIRDGHPSDDQQPKEQEYAVIRWLAGDAMIHAKDLGFVMTKEEAEEFMAGHERTLEEITIERGNICIADQITMDFPERINSFEGFTVDEIAEEMGWDASAMLVLRDRFKKECRSAEGSFEDWLRSLAREEHEADGELEGPESDE